MSYIYKEELATSDIWAIKCPYAMTPEFIVVHNTANDACAENEATYMLRNRNTTSFHYVVDDKFVIKCIPENRNAFHAGDGEDGPGNRKGLAVEICYSKSGGEKFTKAEENAAEFIAELLKLYNWSIDKVKKHQDFSGKYCPHRTLDLGWDRFLIMVKEKLEALKSRLITEAAEISEELNRNYFPINDMSGFVNTLDLAKKIESPLYWGYYKLVNKIKGE